jgi:glutamine synthetase
VAAAAAGKKALNPDLACGYERALVGKLSVLTDQIAMKADDLEGAVRKLGDISDVVEESYAIRDNVLAKMGELRAVADEAETVTADSYWPFPTYGDLLFGVK